MAVALAAILALSGCTTSEPGARSTTSAVSTVTSTVSAVAETGLADGTGGPIVVVPQLDGTTAAGSTSSTTPSATTTAGSSASPTRTTTVKPTPVKPKPKPARIRTVPADGAKNVEPLGTVLVRVAGAGTLLNVRFTNPGGRVLPGKLAKSKRQWEARPELGYGRTYTLSITARGVDGTITRTASKFTTLRPGHLASVVSMVPRRGELVGVGQPIVITFDRAFTTSESRRAVEKQISVRSSARQSGKFRWFSNTELHWRPINFWRPNQTVKVDLKIYGKNLAAGNTYGVEDKYLVFRVGRRMISRVNAKTHIMTVIRNGRTVANWPASLGTDRYPTYNGTHIVTERFTTKVMDSRTWGLTGTGAYRTTVKWATRISASGEFVHGAPWSEYAQGNSNVSHGCINITDERAKWFHDNSLPGDPLVVYQSTGPQLKSWDGYGDWQIDAARY